MLEKWVTELSGSGFARNGDTGVYTKEDQRVIAYLWEIRSRRNTKQIAIKAGIWIVDPFLDPIDQQKKIALAGYLTDQGIDFSEGAPATWWEPGDESIALNALINSGVPSLLQFVQIQNLLAHFEAGLDHGVSNDQAKKERTASIAERLVFGANRFEKKGVRFPPVYNYYLSLLYYHQGIMEKSCEFASTWLNHVSSTPLSYEPERTYRQIDITCSKS